MEELSGKVALVTGSTHGIGEAIARLLSERGAQVVINSFSSIEKGLELANSLKNSVYIQADISNENDCKSLIDTTIQKLGRLDILINNAGTSLKLPSDDLNAISNELFAQTLTANVVGTWCLTRFAIPYLKKTKNACIINMSSIAGVDPASSSSSIPYAVAKAGINHLTKLLANKLGPEIRVNAVAPGLIMTRRAEGFTEAIDKFEKNTSLKRIGKPEDIANIVLGIVNCNYITGQIISVDGGFSVM
jgi:ketoreductase RED2